MSARLRFPHNAAQRFVEAAVPGARIVRIRRLRGGLGAYSHVLTLASPAGARRRVVLRRYFEDKWLKAEDAEREFRVINLLGSIGVPCQDALALDVTGGYFSAPTLLLSYLPGRSQYQVTDPAWNEELVRAMLAIHAVTPESHDLSWLPRFSRDAVADERSLRPRSGRRAPLLLASMNRSSRTSTMWLGRSPA